jgi:hypothetical protein
MYANGWQMELKYPEKELRQLPGVFGEPEEIMVKIAPRVV